MTATMSRSELAAFALAKVSATVALAREIEGHAISDPEYALKEARELVVPLLDELSTFFDGQAERLKPVEAEEYHVDVVFSCFPILCSRALRAETDPGQARLVLTSVVTVLEDGIVPHLNGWLGGVS